MIEFEARFSLDRNITAELSNIGFSKNQKKKMSDIIFEPKDWMPGTGLRKGYFVVRIRLVEGQQPRAETKEYLDDMRWEENSFETEEPAKLAEIFSKIMVPRRVISKERETWKKDGIEICLDEVEKLGKFIEFEGEEKIVLQAISSLGFDLKNKKPNYGAQLFYLEREGKAKFSSEDINKALKNFGF